MQYKRKPSTKSSSTKKKRDKNSNRYDHQQLYDQQDQLDFDNSLSNLLGGDGDDRPVLFYNTTPEAPVAVSSVGEEAIDEDDHNDDHDHRWTLSTRSSQHLSFEISPPSPTSSTSSCHSSSSEGGGEIGNNMTEQQRKRQSNNNKNNNYNSSIRNGNSNQQQQDQQRRRSSNNLGYDNDYDYGNTGGNEQQNQNNNLFQTVWHSMWSTMERKRYEGISAFTQSHNSPLLPPRGKCKALLFGQFIALLATSCNASTFTLSYTYNLQLQMFIMFPMYVLLIGFLLIRTPPGGAPSSSPTSPSSTSSSLPLNGSNEGLQEQQQQQGGEEFVIEESYPFLRIPGITNGIQLRAKWWIYLIYSFFDVFPNFMALMALKFTTLTSVTLLESFCVASTMFFSKLILNRHFKSHHFGAVMLVVVGGLLTLYADIDASSNADDTNASSEGESFATLRPHALLGDMMALLSATSYGLCDSWAEYFVKHIDKYEYLGMVGLFGTFWTGLLFPFLDGGDLKLYWALPSSDFWSVTAIIVWYVVTAVLYYWSDSTFFERSDATLLNLSLQMANIWAILFSVVFYHLPPTAMFYVALLFVTVGIVWYEREPPTLGEGDGPDAMLAVPIPTTDLDNGLYYDDADDYDGDVDLVAAESACVVEGLDDLQFGDQQQARTAAEQDERNPENLYPAIGDNRHLRLE